MRTRQSRRWEICLLSLALTVGAAGCGSGPEATTGPLTGRAAAPVAHSDAEENAAAKAALAAYSGYLDASRTASARSDPGHPALPRFLADPLLTRVRLAIRDAKEHGAMRTGKLVSDPTVVSVDLAADPPTVEIQDCLDARDYRLVTVKDRKTVPGTRGGRYLATATAARYPDGRWLVNTGAAHQDQPC
ncbi:hypothetical protein CO540_18450 [Micromonospora sp. WMMA2032]|uniref:Secreted protein/lipoprotein n=1 Tax=Micromonospora sediminicola TaxID=946078 RepID=A0A1A9B1B0_9ACTN|nr:MULTISPECIES: hypothetical protein [Micromonospora]ATO15574.1 hypothetical protein CO540_18450 [Micromonospora sp. WMMA2032]PGH44011.1 hypothetical protein COO58_05850 [Micromonospora sp. WMMA1996]SBT63265.1 hypothetical protein GA0070622_0211 [Micromonospora sediminicola]